MDISQAQALLGERGRIHQIDVRAGAGVARGLLGRLEARLGERARVLTPEQRTIGGRGLLAAFRLNLTALSLVSLLVGGFLVYASVRASLARRREELGVLRAIGATRAQVLRLVLAEAALLGAAGTALGIPLGWLAARERRRGERHDPNLYLLEGDRGGDARPRARPARRRDRRGGRGRGRARAGDRREPRGPRARCSRRSRSRSGCAPAPAACSSPACRCSRWGSRCTSRCGAAGRPRRSSSRWASWAPRFRSRRLRDPPPRPRGSAAAARRRGGVRTLGARLRLLRGRCGRARGRGRDARRRDGDGRELSCLGGAVARGDAPRRRLRDHAVVAPGAPTRRSRRT